ncbi:metallophosphoesterase MPPED2 [Patella vulgata]|uniref:metallophosphoesterase MPPED2 n=1 Tax=Patella vulgata TaxID=6465 RepID=UPI0024A7A56B|nr:metallophosphoesterase MPPED2 [Patella vulgata]XP_050404567.2 metallophosphoesterase MPPED2 [Patella vulgata]XP_050404570.2 metallophosphoesterase MPPED2 [Patella vulgata]XP_050404571.2 metallophosphoesterase MPPED2 [Patella vulgata]
MFFGDLFSKKDEDKMKEITVHPNTHDPNKAWQKVRIHQKKETVQPLDVNTPITEDKIRFVCLSDTHSVLEKTEGYQLPAGDVLLHAGDFSNIGLPTDIENFNNYLETVPYKVKVAIAGNHELTFDDQFVKEDRERLKHCFCITEKNFEDRLKQLNITNIKEMLTNCIYLEDQSLNLCGIKIYGTPWQPEFCGWGFNLKRGQPCLDKWNLIPEDTDILMSHGPPLGYGDMCSGNNRAGCAELLFTIQRRVKPKYHVFGHIHEDYGVTTDGFTTYINASTCNLRYKAVNPPVVFDMPIPDGHSKSELLYVS